MLGLALFVRVIEPFTSGSTGAANGGFPAIWDHFLFGTAAGKLWKDMTAAVKPWAGTPWGREVRPLALRFAGSRG